LNGLPPNGLAFDGSTTVYVAAGYENESNGQPGQIQMFNTSGTSFGTLTTYDGTHSFGQPNGVAYYGGNIYVVDQVNNAVYEINPVGPTLVNSVTSWASTNPSVAPSAFSGPEGIAVDGNGNVYVADSGNDYIEVFNSALSQTPVTEFGGSGSGNGLFNYPSAVAVTVTGAVTQLFVADVFNQLVQVINNFDISTVFQFSTGSNSDIYGITLDSSSPFNIYLADSQLTPGAGQVEEYNTSGVLQTVGLAGASSSSPDPVGLVYINSSNLLLVADYSNNQLYQVTP
jgi:tripartite motif-containing protein 71